VDCQQLVDAFPDDTAPWWLVNEDDRKMAAPAATGHLPVR
jgi:hypothetical protein